MPYVQMERSVSYEVAASAGVSREAAWRQIDACGGDADMALQQLLDLSVADVAEQMQPGLEDGEDLRGALAAREALLQGKLPIANIGAKKSKGTRPGSETS